jgi:hypothetical protein
MLPWRMLFFRVAFCYDSVLMRSRAVFFLLALTLTGGCMRVRLPEARLLAGPKGRRPEPHRRAAVRIDARQQDGGPL